MVDASVFFKPDFAVVASRSQFAVYKEGARCYTVIQREGGGIGQAEALGPAPKGQECYGLLGIATLQSTKCLVVVSEASFIGTLKEAKIFRVERCDFLPYTSTSSLNRTDTHYITMLQEVINSKGFYFSYTYDLTHSLQRISSFSDMQKSQHIAIRADSRFFWNFHLAQDLITNGALDPLLVVISGFVQSESAQFDRHEVEFTLISRRDRRRAGVRFHTRGLDSDGNAANFVETEQILMVHQNGKYIASSFVQIRGSIPLRWHQKPNLKWAPHGIIYGSAQENLKSAEKHFTEAISSYGEIFIINLIDKKGNQAEMGAALQTLIQSFKHPKVHLTWFDFHHECRALHWEHLSNLVREVEAYLGKYGFFECLLEGNADWGEELIREEQRGVFRTNCMDCLDRTNVVQSVLARNILHRQLHALGISGKPSGEPFQPFPEPLEFCFRSFWANNADVISYLYAGTGALKVDFTRTGKRTKLGALEDGRNSIHRYFINNFYDGNRKNAIDTFLGHLAPTPPSHRHFPLLRFLLVLAMGLALAHTAGKATGQSWSAYFLGLGLGCLMLHKMLTVNGRNLVDRPFLDT